MRENNRINVIGAGLAGCEAANFLANHGFTVHLYEKRPLVSSPAHHTDLFAELVCSNSLKNKKLDNACGLLKEEIRRLGSLMMEASDVSAVPSGDSLAVDREMFAKYITNKIKNNANIIVHYEEVDSFLDGYNIICTGPLSDDKILENIKELTNENSFGFFDASSPIIEAKSIDYSKVFKGGRYDQGEDGYINCPMNKEEYLAFYNELINAKRALIHDFDKDYFEGCLPLEIIASRGVDTLRFGPLKPSGLEKDGEKFYAVVQLRQDDYAANLYNLVGFQTNLSYPEQKRVFRMIPGLENASFVRYGLMHRNSYVYGPKILTQHLELKANPNIYIAGQLSGVEGYVESAASGLLAAYYLMLKIQGKNIENLSYYSVLGSLINYITHTGINDFKPMNANFGIVFKANRDPKEKVIERALEAIEKFKKQID